MSHSTLGITNLFSLREIKTEEMRTGWMKGQRETFGVKHKIFYENTGKRMRALLIFKYILLCVNFTSE